MGIFLIGDWTALLLVVKRVKRGRAVCWALVGLWWWHWGSRAMKKEEIEHMMSYGDLMVHTDHIPNFSSIKKNLIDNYLHISSSSPFGNWIYTLPKILAERSKPHCQCQLVVHNILLLRGLPKVSIIYYNRCWVHKFHCLGPFGNSQGGNDPQTHLFLSIFVTCNILWGLPESEVTWPTLKTNCNVKWLTVISSQSALTFF